MVDALQAMALKGKDLLPHKVKAHHFERCNPGNALCRAKQTS